MRKSLILVLVLMLCFVILAGCGISISPSSSSNNTSSSVENSIENIEMDEDVKGASMSYSSTKKKREDENKNLSKGISVSDQRLKTNDILITLKNNNSKLVDLKIEVEFYDEDDNLVDSQTDNVKCFDPNAEVMSLVGTGYGIDEYDHYKVFVDAEASDDISVRKDLEISNNDNGNQIVTQVLNNSEEEIDSVEIVVLFIKDGEIVGARENSEYNIKPGRSGNLKTSYPYSRKTYKDIEFDEYKVVLKEAYVYDWSF
jgi:hypothetical protein